MEMEREQGVCKRYGLYRYNANDTDMAEGLTRFKFENRNTTSCGELRRLAADKTRKNHKTAKKE